MHQDERRARALLSRALAGCASLSLFGTLGLPWIQVSGSQHYTGAALLLAGLGDQTPYVCGVTDCSRLERFLAGGLPAWTVVAAAIGLLVVARGTRAAGCAVATALLGVVIAGQLAMVAWQGRDATDPNAPAAGVLVVIIVAVVGLFTTANLTRAAASS